jgi:LEA14-like dessication related protein
MIKRNLRYFSVVLITIVVFIFILVYNTRTPNITRVDSISFESMDNGVLSAKTNVSILNPNWFSYHINDLNVSIRYNDKIICNGSFNEPIQLPKSTETSHEFRMNVFIDSLKWEIPSMIFKDSIPVNITLKGNASPFGLSFETTFTKSISTKDLLSQVTTNF